MYIYAVVARMCRPPSFVERIAEAQKKRWAAVKAKSSTGRRQESGFFQASEALVLQAVLAYTPLTACCQT